MKKILMMLTVALSVFMFSCSEDDKGSKVGDYIAQCKTGCEVDNCLTGTVDECKADCEMPTKADCLTECAANEGTDCEAYCTNAETCYNKMEDNCLSQATAAASCEYTCVESKSTCEEEETCYDTCDTKQQAVFTCMLSIDECAAMFEGK